MSYFHIESSFIITTTENFIEEYFQVCGFIVVDLNEDYSIFS